jgi:hypothetical protein
MSSTKRKTLASTVVLSIELAAGATAGAAGAPASDRLCLLKVMDGFRASMTAGRPGSVPLAPDAEVRENTRLVALDQTAWKRVKAVRSSMTFADPVTGNAVSRSGVELDDGKPGYISTRLKVVGGGRISDVEISSDTSQRVVGSYVWNLDPGFEAVLPPEQRSSRVDLEALGRRYFHGLSSHQAVAADFDAGCNRFHSGQQITNVARNAVEGGAARTCASSLEGTPPWGPATEHRFPVVDPERGIVFGVTLLHYPKLPNQPRMYVSEVFKVVGGRIVKIDNIGLMMEGVETLGFTH